MLLLEKWWQFIASFTILNKKYRITNCSTPADNQSAGVFFVMKNLIKITIYYNNIVIEPV